jgi:SAM-dependent methyltransferase
MSEENAGQAEFWSGEVGRRWLEQEAANEALTAEVSARLVAAVRPGDQVLEVGCGPGGLSLLLARAAGPQGQVLGLDISGLLLARAEERRRDDGATNLVFQVADAQDAALPSGRFDLVVSQFGVMFFADTLAAFANLRGALRSGGGALFAVWGPVGANPGFAIPRAAATSRRARAPGPSLYRTRSATLTCCTGRASPRRRPCRRR